MFLNWFLGKNLFSAALLGCCFGWGATVSAALGQEAGARTRPSGVTALVRATVWDGTGAEPLKDAVVLVDEGRIIAVGPREKVAVNSEYAVVDLEGTWIIPGLVDAHVHFFQSAGLYTRPDIIDLQEKHPYKDDAAAIRATLHLTLRRYLAAGVTAVVDMGGPFWNFEVRAKAARRVPSPRVAVAGPLISTVARPLLDLGDPPIIRAESPEHARKLAKAQLELKPDLLKIWFVLTPDRSLDEGVEIVRAVAQEAHAAGIRLAVHATELETARAAVRAGADILVHSIQDMPVDQAFLDLLKARGVIYIPNLVVLEGYAEVLGRDVHLLPIEQRLGDPAVIASWQDMPGPDAGEIATTAAERALKFKARTPIAAANLRPVYEAGIPLAAGTDAGNIGTLHGPSIHRELQMMAAAGLPNTAVLLAVTSGAARVFSPNPDFGTIAPGKAADLLVLDGDPLADLANLARIRHVMRGGRLMNSDDLR